ncbi:prophage endopeptidase tail family protein [Paenibacillus sp. FSL K6-1230]|uniref:prophage endopeptidase tail family protein n=1 Tax=Paenibacillus sp. FSL K6-1230 TaxID=2921603 RepID=UPI0030F5B55A
MITILNVSKQPVAILEDYFNDEITEQINGAYTLNFSVYMDDEKSQYISINNLAEVEGQWFNIVHHKRTRSKNDGVYIEVECEQVSYDLLFTKFDLGFMHTGSPADLLNMALEGTGFTVGTVEFGGWITMDLKEGATARAVLLEIATLTGGELQFDKYTVSLLQQRGQDRGRQFRFGKNLLGIVKDVNAQSGEVLTAYEVDIVELNSSPEFEGLESFELGDLVNIVDEELGINEQQRIIQYSYSPQRRINSKVTIANHIQGIQDTIYRIQTTTVGKDRWMYGVKIGPDEGVVIERYDKKAKTILNADQFRMQRGDGSGSYIDSLYFDPIAGEYRFTGRLIASEIEGGKITGAEIIGGVITGALFRTAEEGHRLEINSDELTAYTSSGGKALTLGQESNGGGLLFMDNGSPCGSIYGNPDGLMIGNIAGVYIRSVDDMTYMQGPVDFTDATVSGLNISSIDGLAEEIASLRRELSYIHGRLVEDLVVNANFDDATRNLKLYSEARTVATVNIPTGGGTSASQ